MTTRYLVAFSNISTDPLGSHTPAGVEQKAFDDLAKAQEFAEGMKAQWNSIIIYDRNGEDGLKRIAMYQGGRRYTA